MADPRTFVVESPQAGTRLDVYLAAQFPEFSRSRLKRLITSAGVTVDGVAANPAARLRAGSRVIVEPIADTPTELLAEAIPLDVVFEDDHLLVINKPPGLSVHPGAGRSRGTLANALIARLPVLREVGAALRPGIVHRLDRDTSGLLVVAKTPAALSALQRAVAARDVSRAYLALVCGDLPGEEGTIDAPIGRHPRHRTKMAVVAGGRAAITKYRVLERLGSATLVEARLVTGRTHQIRVHFSNAGHPVVGDAVYGRRCPLPPSVTPARQMLHAYRLAFHHPVTGRTVEFEAPLPADVEAVLTQLRAHSTRSGPAAEGSSRPARKARVRR